MVEITKFSHKLIKEGKYKLVQTLQRHVGQFDKDFTIWTRKFKFRGILV